MFTLSHLPLATTVYMYLHFFTSSVYERSKIGKENSSSFSFVINKNMAFSNNITAFLNFLVIIFLVVIRSTSLPHYQIYCIFGVYLDIIGIFILLSAFAGLVGALGNRIGFLLLYILAILLLLIFVVVTFITFVLLGATEKYSGGVVLHRGYNEYNLEGFSHWIQTEVTDSDNWSKIRTCVLGRSDVCSKLGQEHASADQFFSGHLSPIQSGCCKPPSICNFQYVNATLWVNATTPTADMDCNLWSNNPTQLCYGCNACKAGYLRNLMMERWKIEVILAVAFFVLLLVFVVGYCATGNALNKGGIVVSVQIN